jgi:hypothetical protein
MNCFFCSQPCILDFTSEYDGSSIEICSHHPYPVNHYIYPGKQQPTCGFRVPVEDKIWFFNFIGNRFWLVQTEIKPYPKTSRAITIDNITGITPENALQKLPLLITFS